MLRWFWKVACNCWKQRPPCLGSFKAALQASTFQDLSGMNVLLAPNARIVPALQKTRI
jgi:hypothetical protein